MTKRILALLTALLMTLPLVGCLVPNNDKPASDGASATDAVAAPATATAADGTGAQAFDGEAIAVEIGDLTIDANEIRSIFESYIDMFSYYGTVDEATVEQCITMAEDEVIRYYVPLWKANELGVSLSDDVEAELMSDADNQVAEERNALLCQFAYYYGEMDDIPDDESQLTEQQRTDAIAGIEEQLAQMFYAGFTFDDYLALEHESILESLRIDRLTELLRADYSGPVDAAAIDTWYAETLESQKTKYDATPLEFYSDKQSYDMGFEDTPILYAPEGYARVQVISLAPDGEPDAAIEANGARLLEIEAAYGALALNGGDEAELNALKEEYAALKAENDALEASYYGDTRTAAEAAYTALLGGMTFEDAMEAYNAKDEDGKGMDERYVYLLDADPYNGELADVVKTLSVGDYSKPVLVDGAYVIVKLCENLPAGAIDRASIADEITAAATAALTDEAWEAQFDEWLTEAKEIAVFHRETYEMIGDDYLY